MKVFDAIYGYLPEVLGVAWVVLFAGVVFLSYYALLSKRSAPKALDFSKLKKFDYVGPGGKLRGTPANKVRLEHYEDFNKTFKGFMLVHTLMPSEKPGAKYNVSIYVMGDKSIFFSDIESAEFMFGPDWNNRIFKVIDKIDGCLGVTVSTSAPFLCTCCVTMRDGGRLYLDRYIDFEMGGIFDKQ